MSGDDGDDSNILRPDFGDPKIVIDRRGEYSCSHNFVQLRKKNRTVVCRQCRMVLDPFDVLEDVAQKWETCTWEEKKISELHASLDELKREEANMKGRIRGARKAAAEPKSVLYFEELMRRVSLINNRNDEREVFSWMQGFRWLNTEQDAALKQALIRAKRRVEDTKAAEPRRPRRVRVVNGGKLTAAKPLPSNDPRPL